MMAYLFFQAWHSRCITLIHEAQRNGKESSAGRLTMHEVMIRIGEEHETMSLASETRDEALAMIFSLYDPFIVTEQTEVLPQPLALTA